MVILFEVLIGKKIWNFAAKLCNWGYFGWQLSGFVTPKQITTSWTLSRRGLLCSNSQLNHLCPVKTFKPPFLEISLPYRPLVLIWWKEKPIHCTLTKILADNWNCFGPMLILLIIITLFSTISNFVNVRTFLIWCSICVQTLTVLKKGM